MLGLSAATDTDKLKVSGYIQAQYQYGEEDASLSVGAGNENEDEGFHRVGIRRGRIKFAYEEGIASAVFQLDLTEKGIGFKDAYLNLKDPWMRSSALRAGIFDRPFGYEIAYSSSRRESPERSLVFRTLFPEERDLGAMLILQAPKSSPFHLLKLEAGLFAGNGIKQETDSRKDFIGHLSVEKALSKTFVFGAGMSYYYGGVYQGTENVYTTTNGRFVLDSNADNVGEYAKREYIGFDGRMILNTIIGKTQLRGEYLTGTQPGLAGSSKSPNASMRPSADTYIRNFQGGYTMLVQDLGKSPVALVLKYDWYDPNTKAAANQIGENGTTKTDISRSTWGIGALWNLSKFIRLQAYYDINLNEKSNKLAGYEGNVKDNAFTLRLQYKF